jgi:Ca-activated chloride channel family protein
METFAVHRTLKPATETREYALLRIRAASVLDGPAPRLAVVLVLDASGSMAGEPITQVIQSTKRLAEILGDTDSLGVVSFAAGAETVAPLQTLTRQARHDVQSAAARITAGGGTNMSGGMAHGALLYPARGDDERQVMIVLSDGQPNIGASTPELLSAEAKRIRERGVSISTLGFGKHHSDDVMVALADAGGGRYAFINDPRLAAQNFARALGAQRDVVAESVSLTLTPGEGVEILRVFGDPPTSFGSGGLKVGLQDMVMGDELNVVVELKLRAPEREGPWVALGATLTGRATGTREAIALPMHVTIAVAQDGGGEFEPVAVVASAVALADDTRARARACAERKDFRGAVALLKEARQALIDTPGYRKGSDDPLDDAVESLTDEITALEKTPTENEYNEYKKAARDYLDFGQSGTKTRGSSNLAFQSPSMMAISAKMNVIVPEAYLVAVNGERAGERLRLVEENDIGRGIGVRVRVASPAVSRRHATVVFNQNDWWVIDMRTTNGTRHNGAQVERARLAHGDVIEVGGTVFRFEKSGP